LTKGALQTGDKLAAKDTAQYLYRQEERARERIRKAPWTACATWRTCPWKTSRGGYVKIGCDARAPTWHRLLTLAA
jgi:hypothetical protein